MVISSPRHFQPTPFFVLLLVSEVLLFRRFFFISVFSSFLSSDSQAYISSRERREPPSSRDWVSALRMPSLLSSFPSSDILLSAFIFLCHFQTSTDRLQAHWGFSRLTAENRMRISLHRAFFRLRQLLFFSSFFTAFFPVCLSAFRVAFRRLSRQISPLLLLAPVCMVISFIFRVSPRRH